MKKIPEIKTARRKPDFAGTPGALVSLEGLNLVFGGRLKSSPYDTLLDQLATAQPGQALKFDDVKAKASVYARSKKKGLKVSFAELNGALYVRLDGRVEDDVRKRRREQIVAALKKGPLTHFALASRMREAGDGSIDAVMVETILTQMLRDCLVLKREASAGGGVPEWALTAKAAKAA